MIFRAFAEHSDVSERMVFIEATNRDDARERLPLLLAAVWDVPISSIDIYNLAPEFELRNDPFADRVEGDDFFFLIGWHQDGPSFWHGQHGHPLFFLNNQHDRVMSAYLRLSRPDLPKE